MQTGKICRLKEVIVEIVFLFYEGMTALDAIGPHEILCRLPGANVRRVAQDAGLIRTDSGLILTAEYSLSDVPHADVLVVPGAGNASTLGKSPKTLEWIYSIHQRSKWTTSVCTGSLILGAANVLSGVRATSHWAAFDRLEQFGALPTHGRVIEDGKVMTAAGVSAGIDLGLNLAAKLVGEAVAHSIQLGIEYDPCPVFDVGSPEKALPAIREHVRARMLAAFEPTAS